jgi:hypothetical protein
MSLPLTGLQLLLILQYAFACCHEVLQTLLILFVGDTCDPQSLQMRHGTATTVHDLTVSP